MESLRESFDAPIPGMALTAELGGRPWQNPPRYTTVEDTIDYYISRMSTDEFEAQLLDVLEMGVPVTSIVEVTQLTGVMQGMHSVDVGILVAPILMEFIMLVADAAGVEYNSGLEDDDPQPSKSAIAKAISKFKEVDKKTEEQEPAPVMEEPKEEQSSEPMGLMARRS